MQQYDDFSMQHDITVCIQVKFSFCSWVEIAFGKMIVLKWFSLTKTSTHSLWSPCVTVVLLNTSEVCLLELMLLICVFIWSMWYSDVEKNQSLIQLQTSIIKWKKLFFFLLILNFLLLAYLRIQTDNFILYSLQLQSYFYTWPSSGLGIWCDG